MLNALGCVGWVKLVGFKWIMWVVLSGICGVKWVGLGRLD